VAESLDLQKLDDSNSCPALSALGFIYRVFTQNHTFAQAIRTELAHRYKVRLCSRIGKQQLYCTPVHCSPIRRLRDGEQYPDVRRQFRRIIMWQRQT